MVSLKGSSMQVIKKIPYGISNYKDIRAGNYYYLDKTRFIPLIEDADRFLFLIRPRRFGKSSLLTVLEAYYDISRKDDFLFYFKDTYIETHSTPEKHAYLILKFNFSRVDPNMEQVAQSFKDHTDDSFYFFGQRYKELLGNQFSAMIQTKESPHSKLAFLLDYVGSIGLKVYILIDEYDNFTNTILTTDGQSAYHELTHGAGFFRFFFNILKGAVDQIDSGIGRMFITGVSPITMDDVTSGFNIGTNISLYGEFNELLGFTNQNVKDMIMYYKSCTDMQVPDVDQLINLMHEWYDGYRFSPHATETVYNSDMVLYFTKQYMRRNAPPDNMIDHNIHIDYSKLRHLMVLDKRLNGNFRCLEEIIKSNGTGPVKVADSFPVEHLIKPSNFISLLFYFGLLSYTNVGSLQIPNETVKQLMYRYIRDGYEDVNIFNIDIYQFSSLIRHMAYHGEWTPVFQFIAKEIERQTAIRDYLTGEKVIQTFLLAYLNITDYFIIRSEEEMNKGFADIYIEPFSAKYPDINHSFLIELKYIGRNEFTQEVLNQKIAEADHQLNQYIEADWFIKRNINHTVTCLSMVYCGWEMKEIRQVLKRIINI